MLNLFFLEAKTSGEFYQAPDYPAESSKNQGKLNNAKSNQNICFILASKTNKTISKASEFPDSQNVTIEDLVDPAHMVKETAHQIREDMEKLSERLESKFSKSTIQEQNVATQMKHTNHRPSIQSQRCTIRQVRRQNGGSGERRGSHENPQLLSMSFSIIGY